MMDAWKSKTFSLTAGAGALLVAVSAAVLAVHVPKLPTEIILHFTRRGGIDLFGTPSDLWWMFAVAGTGVAIDLAAGSVLYRRDRTLSYLLAAAAPLMGLLLLIAILTIVGVN